MLSEITNSDQDKKSSSFSPFHINFGSNSNNNLENNTISSSTTSSSSSSNAATTTTGIGKWWKKPMKLVDNVKTYISLWSQSGNQEDAIRWWNSRGTMPLDDEIVYSKNNVCIHPPALVNAGQHELHHPGYLTLRCQKDEILGHTLILTWIPNSSLNTTTNNSPDHIYNNQQEEKKNNYMKNVPTSAGQEQLSQQEQMHLGQARDSLSESNDFITEKVNSLLINEFVINNNHEDENVIGNNNTVENCTVELVDNRDCNTPSHSPPLRHVVKQTCGVFSVDLGLMRSVRIFYNQNSQNNGQVVIASREAQYKVLHFHHGGLDKFDESLAQWRFLTRLKTSKKDSNDSTNYKVYTVIRPQYSRGQRHPEDSNQHPLVSMDIWRQYVNSFGQIENDYLLRKAIFFGGLDPLIRKQAWLFLLDFYPFDSTHEEREEIRQGRFHRYCELRGGWITHFNALQDQQQHNDGDDDQNTSSIYNTTTNQQNHQLSPEMIAFAKYTLTVVEKDVIRTDRRNPYYAGHNNDNLTVLQELLMTYALHHPEMGYHQGMSDLAAPLLSHLQDPVLTYFCFENLMGRSVFWSSPTDSDMDKQLTLLRELLRLMEPTFYKYILSLGDDSVELLFCHRWLLLGFKREFYEPEALRLWESCWCRFATDHFLLFIAVAVIRVYGTEVIDQNLTSDDLLLHFGSLAGHMDVEVILVKARYLLHEFRCQTSIPCTLTQLCITRRGPGMWDAGHTPAVICAGHLDSESCPSLSSSAEK